MANLQVSIESAFFKETRLDSRFYISICMKSVDPESKVDKDKVHRTSLSSGKSSNAVFNVHSFNIGDVEQEPPTSILEFKAYRVITKNGKPLSEELIGECRIQMAQMWVQEFHLKKRKSLGLIPPTAGQGKARDKEIARFNLSYMLIHSDNVDHIQLESRTLI